MTYRRWLSSICLILLSAVLLTAAVMILATPIVTAPDFLKTFPDATLRVQERGFTLRNRVCDVLIYGDSTALTGVDPRVIHAGTGLTACNISATRPIIDAVGLLPVDDFLLHNPKPKILVLQFAPEDFFPGKRWEGLSGIAPLSMLLRQRPGWRSAATMLAHPDVTIRFYVLVLENHFHPPTQELAHFNMVYKQAFLDYDSSNGLLPYLQPTDTGCTTAVQPLNGPLDAAWVQDLRSKYQAQGIKVLVKASPLPVCDPQLAFFQNALRPVVDSNVVAMPVDSFVGGNRHMNLSGAQAETRELSKLLQAQQPH